MKATFDACKFQHQQIVRVADPASPFYGQRLEIGVRAFDTIVERNPTQEYRYAGTLIDLPEAPSETFLESQLEVARWKTP